MAQRKRTKMIYKTLHRNLNIEQHEPHTKLGVNSDVPKGYAVIAPHMASIVIIVFEHKLFF